MKARIRRNSLRLRLSRPEVDSIGAGGLVESYIDFGGSRLAYCLDGSQDRAQIRAEFRNNRITVFLPKSLGSAWAKGETISLEAEQPLGAESRLRLLIEKDFTCLKPRAVLKEDESDLFPNPQGGGCG